MFCSNCGNSLSEKSKYCQKCGIKVENSSPVYVNSEKKKIAPGKILLRISGVIIVVIGIIFTIIFFDLLSRLRAVNFMLVQSAGLSPYTFVAIMLIYSIYTIAVGVAGFLYSARIDKARLCRTLAIIMIIADVVTGILGSMVRQFDGMREPGIVGWASAIFMWSVVIAYIVGAQKNLKMVR